MEPFNSVFIYLLTILFFIAFVFGRWLQSLVLYLGIHEFQTGKFFQELSEFVGHNPGMFMVEKLTLRLGYIVSGFKSPGGLPPARPAFDSWVVTTV